MKMMIAAAIIGLIPTYAVAAGWFLVLVDQSGTPAVAVIPDRYPTKPTCVAAGVVWNAARTTNYSYVCLPAP